MHHIFVRVETSNSKANMKMIPSNANPVYNASSSACNTVYCPNGKETIIIHVSRLKVSERYSVAVVIEL